MPRRSFKNLLDEFPRTHLIVGCVESLSATEAAEKAIDRLIERVGQRADWATGQMQDGRGFSMHWVRYTIAWDTIYHATYGLLGGEPLAAHGTRNRGPRTLP